MSNFFTPEFNNESAIAPWNASLEPTKAIIPKLDANPVLTGGIGQEVNIPTLTPEAYDNIILPDASLTRMASAVSTDSNISLPDSSVDLLTGEAMSEVYGDLSKFAADPDFAAKLNVPFGENWDAAAAKTLAEAWFKGDFSDIPPVKVVSSGEIGGANGAFAAATDTIYLSKEFLAGNAANPAAVADVLLEEIGHSVDARLNVTDSPGDEGAIFGAIVQGKELSEGELQGLKSEDDIGTVLFNGQTISIEKAGFDIQNKWATKAFNWDSNSKSWQQVWNGTGYKDFGSNTRIDGKKGFAKDWGDGSPGDGVNNDFFLLNFLTQADFEKDQNYKFQVRADDRYYIAALPVNGDKWEYINWEGKEDAYGGKEIQWKPENNGKYWLFSYYMERDSKAYFDISWEKVNGSYSPSPDPNRRVDNDLVERNIGKTKGGNDRRIAFERVNSPGYIENRPTWVIIHGWNGKAGDLKDLGQAIERYDGYQIGDQVLTLDWDAARTGLEGLNAAGSWITTVGEKAAETLNGWGINSSNINLVGHSLGTYVAAEIAKKIPGGVNKLIALDPAATTLGGYQEEDKVNFSDNSQWAWAFYGSAAGSEERAATADESWSIGFGGVPLWSTNDNHGRVVNVFASMVEQVKNNPNHPISQYFDLSKMSQEVPKIWMQNTFNSLGGNVNGNRQFEGRLEAKEENGRWVPRELKYEENGTGSFRQLTA
ncbi:MAG: hypothetical protein ACBR50_02250 [Microcoleus sp.]